MLAMASKVAIAAAVLYTLIHIVSSGILDPLRLPNVGQVVEELQPIYRQIVLGTASVDHPRQYGPIFLFALDPVYRADPSNLAVLARYAYLLDLLAIGVAFAATVFAIRTWLASQGMTMSPWLLLALGLLWGNFSPLYGVLIIKNVELWELAFIMVGCAALMRGWRATAGWAVAAAAMTKMLPFVFFPYLLLRDRRTFAHAMVALMVILGASQLVYGSDMGWRYLPNILRAATGSAGFGNGLGMTWHENVSVSGVVNKAFGYLEPPNPSLVDPPYPLGYYVFMPEGRRVWASAFSLAAQAAGLLWMAWTLVRWRRHAEPGRTYWDWAFVAAMMLVLAPQSSHDYMVLALGAFSFVLAGCFVQTNRANRVIFAVAVLLVANVAPRGLFARAVLIDPLVEWAGYQHLTRAEAYQYFGFPLLGLLLMVLVLVRQATAGQNRPSFM